jgi:hypothetical protein
VELHTEGLALSVMFTPQDGEGWMYCNAIVNAPGFRGDIDYYYLGSEEPHQPAVPAAGCRRPGAGAVGWRGQPGCWRNSSDFVKIAEDCTAAAAKVLGFLEDCPKMAKMAQVGQPGGCAIFGRRELVPWLALRPWGRIFVAQVIPPAGRRRP